MYRIINRKRIRQLRKMRFWRRRSSDLTKPRLCVFKSSRHIQAQVIDDAKGIVIACASSIEADVKSTGFRGKTVAVKVGSLVAERAKSAGVSAVVFDRNGFTYHGRIQVLADSAREAGLQF
jgi:large subunit ribosomal protein L18